MKLAYKVVNVDIDGNRKSAWLNSFGVLKFSKYCLEYPEGEYVTAPKNSIGIMCFKSYNFAESWMRFLISHFSNYSGFRKFKIIELTYHCKEKVPNYILRSYPDHLIESLYKYDLIFESFEGEIEKWDSHISKNIILGTICIPKAFCLT